MPEVALWFDSADPMVRSCRIGVCYAPIAWPSDQKDNDSEKLYVHYLQQDGLQRESFLSYCRHWQLKSGKLVARHARGKNTIAIGVRYCAELKDKFVGELAAMLMPHSSREQLQGPDEDIFASLAMGSASWAG